MPAVISRPRTLVVVAVALAIAAALPVIAVVARGAAPGAGATWAHLADTVLARYVGNTLALVVLVGSGVAFGGTLTGWALAQFRFRGSAFFEWALLLPLAMPAYVMAYAYTDLLQYAGPVQTGVARGLRVVARRLLVPRRPLPSRRRDDVRLHALPLRLPARANGLPRAPGGVRRSRAHARARTAATRSGASSCRSRGRRSPAASRSR